MEQLSNQEEWKPWMAFVLEAVVLLLLYFVGSRMQLAWGLVGLVLTEVMFLALAIAVALLHQTPLKEVFPIKKITIKEIFGLIIFAIAGMMINLIALGISMCVVPNFADEVTGMSEFLYSDISWIVSVLIVAVLPAICEESIHRGAILSHLRSLKKDWVIVLIMGCFFGLFHLSFLRFLSTACLGAILSYLMVKKNNMLLPMLLHFLNNFMSTLSGMVSSGADSSVDSASALASISPLQLLGTYCIIGFLAPVLLVVADSLVCPKLHKKHWVITVLISIAILIVGVVCTSIGAGLI